MSYYPPPSGSPSYIPPTHNYAPAQPPEPRIPCYRPFVPPLGPCVRPPPPGGMRFAHFPPAGRPPPIRPGPNQMMAGPVGMNPRVPFEHPLPLPGQDGLMIILHGNVPPNCIWFHVNLLAGPEDDPPVALHINPRFEGTNQVVRNSCSSGCWGEEERQGGFPFVQGCDFELIILFTNDAFKIAVNGSHFCDFQYRMHKEDVTHMSVEGDVFIQRVNFKLPAQPTIWHGPNSGDLFRRIYTRQLWTD